MSNKPVSARPRRSFLYMPADRAKVLEKAKTLPADALMFDLEDAVAPENKPAARTLACQAVRDGGYGAREMVIRMNGLDTQWGHDDLKAIVAAAPDGILVPKVETATDVHTLNDALTTAGAPDTFALWIMIEMPRAILNLNAIAACAETTRLKGFVMGTNDLAKEYRAQWTPDRLAFQTALQLTVAAARGYNLFALDGVYNDISNIEGLKAECAQGRILGFDGKTLIHPTQIEAANTAFSPAPEDIIHAEAVIAAFAAPENADKAVLKVNGKMTELLHLEEARQIIAIATAIAVMQD